MGTERQGEWDMRFDGLGALDSLSKGVLDAGRPLVNRIGSVGIETVVPLQTIPSAPGSLNQRGTDVRGDPN